MVSILINGSPNVAKHTAVNSISFKLEFPKLRKTVALLKDIGTFLSVYAAAELGYKKLTIWALAQSVFLSHAQTTVIRKLVLFTFWGRACYV